MTDRAPPAPEQDEPLDPAVERVRAKLMRFVVINLGILFLAVMAVVAALVYRSLSGGEDAVPNSTLATPPQGSVITGEIALPAGSQVLSQSLSDGRLTLLVETTGGSEIVVYDVAAARIIARFGLVDE